MTIDEELEIILEFAEANEIYFLMEERSYLTDQKK